MAEASESHALSRSRPEIYPDPYLFDDPIYAATVTTLKTEASQDTYLLVSVLQWRSMELFEIGMMWRAVAHRESIGKVEPPLL